MKKPITYLTLFLLLFICVSCTGEEGKHQIVCTELFASVNISFKDTQGNFIDVEDYKVLNARTNKVLSTEKENKDTSLGQYLVVNDNNKAEFSTSGDVVLISGKHPLTKVVKQVELKISADDCHIKKISGPSEIVFD